ncbi:MAG: ribose-phosphate diphosphokinase [Candidatus Thermoplasmatota archaeon]|nr:ribose-phosphate diphosphokinase [Candidatus Thermoplasmatota archaeon]MCL5438121.1 ribose-phosphate diphosphokinase [Candidatus Thermoplasmatota archaeon]
MIIVPGLSARRFSESVSRASSAEIANISRSRFPDGEMYLRIESPLRGEDILVISTSRTEAEIIDLMLLLEASRGMKPASVTLLLPYFGYARQHMRYREGEPISSSVIGNAIFSQVDRGFVVEVHDQGALEPFAEKVINLKVETSIAEFFRGSKPDYVVSPDDGGEDRVDSLARKLGSKTLIMEKERIDSRNVEIEIPEVNLNDKSVLLLDDMISTGGTIMKACSILKKKGASDIRVAAVHGLFINDSYRQISTMTDGLAVTNTLESPYSKIDISGEIYPHIGKW